MEMTTAMIAANIAHENARVRKLANYSQKAAEQRKEKNDKNEISIHKEFKIFDCGKKFSPIELKVFNCLRQQPKKSDEVKAMERYVRPLSRPLSRPLGLESERIKNSRPFSRPLGLESEKKNKPTISNVLRSDFEKKGAKSNNLRNDLVKKGAKSDDLRIDLEKKSLSRPDGLESSSTIRPAQTIITQEIYIPFSQEVSQWMGKFVFMENDGEKLIQRLNWCVKKLHETKKHGNIWPLAFIKRRFVAEASGLRAAECELYHWGENFKKLVDEIPGKIKKFDDIFDECLATATAAAGAGVIYGPGNGPGHAFKATNSHTNWAFQGQFSEFDRNNCALKAQFGEFGQFDPKNSHSNCPLRGQFGKFGLGNPHPNCPLRSQFGQFTGQFPTFYPRAKEVFFSHNHYLRRLGEYAQILCTLVVDEFLRFDLELSSINGSIPSFQKSRNQAWADLAQRLSNY